MNVEHGFALVLVDTRTGAVVELGTTFPTKREAAMWASQANKTRDGIGDPDPVRWKVWPSLASDL